jgi:hypothetical protein
MAEYFALEDALAAGLTPADIVPVLADRKNYDYQAARQAGVTDEQIISTLMGETAFSGAMKRFIQAGGSSIKGAVDLYGGLNKERALAERTAAGIASANAPVAGMVGEFAGAIADPVTAPAFVLKGLKAATLAGTMAKQGAVQGALGGVLEPVLTPEESRLFNTVAGTAVGTVFGAGLGKASEGVINFLEKRAIKAADADTTKTAIDDVAKAIDNPPSKQAAEAQAAQAVNYDTPAYLRRAEAEGTPAPIARELDPVQVKLVEERIAKAEAEIAKHETDLANVQKQQPEKDVGDFLGLKDPTKKPTEKQVAALFKAPENQDLPAKFGLVAPTREAPAKQVAALFKSATPEEVPVIKQQIVEAAKQGTAQQYLVKQIETKKAEVEKLKGMIAPPAREFPIQVETRQGATPQQMAARDARVQQVMERTGRAEPMPVEAPRAPVTQVAPLTAAQTQQLASLQKVLDDNGFKNVDEAVVASGRPDEVAAAQARIDAGTPTTPEQAVRGFQSGGSAATPRELVYAESVPFQTNAEKLLTGGQTRGANVAPVSANEQWNDLFSKAVGVIGAKGRQLRGRGEFGGSLEGTQKAGAKAAARMEREEGSIEDWVFKQDDKGNFPNIDKSWNRAEVEAFRPVYEEARATLSANLSEINRLRDAGELTDAALQTLTYRSQLPIGILGIYQGQRTKASDTLNAFKLAKSQFEAGKEVKGLFQPGVDCQ